MTTTEKPAADNGVDVPFLLGARTALSDEPPVPSSSGARRPSGSRAPTRAAR